MKNKELTRDEMCILRDILDTILDDRQVRRAFNQIHGTTPRQLDRLATKLATLVKSPVVGVPPLPGGVAFARHQESLMTRHCTYCGADVPNSKGECGKCGL